MAATSSECLLPAGGSQGRAAGSPVACSVLLNETHGMHRHRPPSRQRQLPATEARGNRGGGAGPFFELDESTVVVDPGTSVSRFALEGKREAPSEASTMRPTSRRFPCEESPGGLEGASAFTAGLGAADVAAAASPDSGLGSPGHQELVLGLLGGASRRLEGRAEKRSAEGAGSSEQRDPALEAALQQRRERRGQRRLDRMVRRMGLLEHSRRSQSDGNFDWLKPQDLEFGDALGQGDGLRPRVVGSSCLGVKEVDGGLVLSAPERLLPDSRN